MECDRLSDGWLNGGRGNARAEDAQGTPTQSHISPSMLVYADIMIASIRRHSNEKQSVNPSQAEVGTESLFREEYAHLRGAFRGARLSGV